MCVSEQGSGRRTITWNIGVSPMEFNDPIMVNHKLVQDFGGRAYTTRLRKDFVLSQAKFSRTRRDASHERERTSVRDRPGRVFQRSYRTFGAERALGYMTK